MESDILGVFQCGTSQERKGKSTLFNGKKSTSLKNGRLACAKKAKISDQVHGNNLQSKLFRSKASSRARMPGDFRLFRPLLFDITRFFSERSYPRLWYPIPSSKK
ncbi:hypothetical protein [Listeria immobilis]|uniref:hypothetical protein n=1 Tax=Listeria immobilis TaxID=2713502 RepID=UPI00164D3385|nr:hypothetical protein [Listeria immobilis]MBC6313712.1 hypothetical protein [Listeria immobilis]